MAAPHPDRTCSPRPWARARAGLLVLCIMLAGCVPGFHEFEMPARDTAAREQAILEKTPDDELAAKAREHFAAGRFDVAARRFAVLRARHPEDLETTVRLGLALWFDGRADETKALWTDFAKTSDPVLARHLVLRASGLTLLARRLAARRILTDFEQGLLLPADADGLVLLPEAGQPDAARDALPPMNLALSWLLERQLADGTRPRPAGRELVRALRDEMGQALPGDLDAALALAHILGAGYAATVGAEIPEDEPELLRTTLRLTIAEPPRVRALRLDAARRQAESSWSAAEIELRRLEETQDRCNAVLDYFQGKERLSELLNRRKAEADEAARLNREGDADGAAAAMNHYQETTAAMAELQARLKDYERRLVLDMDGARRFTLEAYRELSERLTGQRRDLEARMAGLRKAAWDASARASVIWPPLGRVVSFDLPLAQLSSWPDKAARELAALAGESAPASRAQGTWDLDGLKRLDQALAAWDNGEYTTAEGLFAQAADICPEPPPSPGADFDLLRLAGLGPGQLADLFLADFGLPQEEKRD